MSLHAKKSFWHDAIALSAIITLIVLISIDVIRGTLPANAHIYLRVQLAIYMVLLTDLVIVLTFRLSRNRISSLFKTYIALLIIVLYFSSLVFYAEEHAINSDVTTYGEALWWAVMCMTTAGSYISETTLTGKILSVILSGGGLILFPVFTVYITNAVMHKDASD